MKKVLFITYFFPPLGGAGVGRSLKFAKYLPKFGWQPIVISASESVKYGKDYSLMEEISNELKVYRIGHKEITKEWGYLTEKLKLVFNYPDCYKSWYHPAIKKAREIIKNEKIDLIFSSSAPFISHFIAMNLKKEFKIPWIADFRDPWYGNDQLDLHRDQFLLSPLCKVFSAKIKNKEEEIINKSDKTVVVSWHHKQNLCKAHNIKRDLIKVITNGYDENEFNKAEENRFYPNKLTIIFVGSFYTGFKEMFAKFLNVIEKIDKNIEIVIIGKAAEEAKNFKNANLTCIYNIPKKKLIPLCAGSNFLFLMTLPNAEWCIPGKTYEYLYLNRPIIALVPEAGDTAMLIKKAQAGFVIPYDKKVMERQLREIFRKYKEQKINDFKNDRGYIKQFERRILTEKLASIFDSVLK